MRTRYHHAQKRLDNLRVKRGDIGFPDLLGRDVDRADVLVLARVPCQPVVAPSLQDGIAKARLKDFYEQTRPLLLMAGRVQHCDLFRISLHTLTKLLDLTESKQICKRINTGNSLLICISIEKTMGKVKNFR